MSSEQQTLWGERAAFADSDRTECPFCNGVVHQVEYYRHLKRCRLGR